MNQPHPHALTRLDGNAGARRHFRYFDYMLAAFVAILLLSNLIGAAKTAEIGGHKFGAGILFFPISYILGDVLTEVYGYANARRCVWAGFFAQLFMAFMSIVVVAMPQAADWGCAASGDPAFAGVLQAHNAGFICQATYVSVFGSTVRIVAASVTAFWVGEFVNSFVLAKMKIWTGGKHLWTRTWGSTICGQAADSLLFYPLAFYGVWTTEDVLTVLVTNWALKVLWEILLTPATYAVVGFLKSREGVDVFDDGTAFSPFAKAPAV
ncbi:MAG: queuosine precursor transporter [Sphingomonadales bacterium]|nr:queuosine precursor transporter [Sphingomonadales bacterium]